MIVLSLFDGMALTCACIGVSIIHENLHDYKHLER